MAIWYRVHFSNNLQDVFSGDGGLYVAGRWNPMGRKAVYCSQSIALATLEWLSHNGLSVSGYGHYRYSIKVPDRLITRFDVKDLPDGWNAVPDTVATHEFGETHLFSAAGGKTPLAISVPSVLVPDERNLVLNPLHRSYATVLSDAKCEGWFEAPRRS